MATISMVSEKNILKMLLNLYSSHMQYYLHFFKFKKKA